MKKLLVLLVWFLGACGDDQPCGGCPIGDACVDEVCTPIPCFGGCPIGQVCIDNACAVPDEQCAELGVECEPTFPTVDGTMCVDLDGFGPQVAACTANCDYDGSCASGSLCFWLGSSLDPTCSTQTDCEFGQQCLGGACRDTVCRPSECEGTLAGLQTCQEIYAGAAGFEDGVICAEFENSANYCFPAGTKGLKESCTELADAAAFGDFTNTCASGLACVERTCRTPCTDNSACGADETCLLADQNAVGKGVGFCEKSCTPFEVGSCGAGNTCLPLSDTQGVCTPAGTVAAFEACDPAQNNCVDGTVCAIYQDANVSLGIPEVARCQPICNVTVGPEETDGTVSQTSQALRDATCPNPPPSNAALVVTNLGSRSPAVDVYVDGLPVAQAIASQQRSAVVELAGGQKSVRVLAAGAPSTDAALAEVSLGLASSKLSELVVYDEPLVLETQDVAVRSASTQNATLEVVGLGVDLFDVIAVPAGDDLQDPSVQVEVWTTQVSTADLVSGAWDFIAFAPGAVRNDRFNAVAELNNVQIAGPAVLYLTGTLADADDLLPRLTVFERLSDPAVDLSQPRYVCQALTDAYGACRQTCPEGGEGYFETCQGSAMGCMPEFVTGPDAWMNICGPVGPLEGGQRCAPFATFGGCGEGLYCAAFGNTAPNFDPVERGVCTSLCDTTDESSLSCAPQQDCRPLDFGGFEMGQCPTPCDPTGFGDNSCPAGQQACLPVSSLRVGGDGMTPVTQEEASFCAASGSIAIGQACAGSDCVPGSECLFPRSPQSGFVTSLLSQYVGNVGLESTCVAQCNPFDGTGADACPEGQTCLFNFPYNADVGSCAPIGPVVEPLQPCQNPGESCGVDAICAVDGDQNTCYRFCQFLGVAADGTFERSTCPATLRCNPLVNDLGVCLNF